MTEEVVAAVAAVAGAAAVRAAWPGAVAQAAAQEPQAEVAPVGRRALPAARLAQLAGRPVWVVRREQRVVVGAAARLERRGVVVQRVRPVAAVLVARRARRAALVARRARRAALVAQRARPVARQVRPVVQRARPVVQRARPVVQRARQVPRGRVGRLASRRADHATIPIGACRATTSTPPGRA